MTSSSEPESTVFIVDDDKDVRRSLELLLRSVRLRVATFASADEFLKAFEHTGPSCLVLDVRMPGMSGMELQQRLIEAQVQLPIIMITAHAEVDMAVAALKLGATDFIQKPYSPQQLLEKIHKALDQDRASWEKMSERKKTQARLELLTSREQEVLELLILGKMTKVIAKELGISQTTVDYHRNNIQEKLGVENVVQLTRLVEQHRQSGQAPGP